MSLEDLLTDKMVDTILFKDVYKVFSYQNCLIANTPTSLPSKQKMFRIRTDSKKFVYIEDEITILIIQTTI